MPVTIVERSSNRIVIREDARPGSSIVHLAAALALIAIPFLLPKETEASARRLWIATLVLVPPGLNRMLGTSSTFDYGAGVVSIARTLGRIIAFRRRFPMSEVIRVFHDERAYTRPNVQNPRLEFSNGQFVNMSQWCPVETDLEAEVAAANRLLHRCKQARSKAAGENPLSFAETFGEATPQKWTLEGLSRQDEGLRRRNRRWIKRSVVWLFFTVVLFAIGGSHFPLLLGVVLLSAAGTLVLSIPLLIDLITRHDGKH